VGDQLKHVMTMEKEASYTKVKSVCAWPSSFKASCIITCVSLHQLSTWSVFVSHQSLCNV